MAAKDLHLDNWMLKLRFSMVIWRTYIDEAAKLYHAGKGAVGLQAQEESLWLRTGFEVVVPEI